ncbi:hypothetical protein DH2020_040274 [Rehmannia glutinosa]|uniref:Uncharacterized protein n=1 Tax=Rehmannia glutinosa TaxID=99300 RepID=A0ABR0UVG8_REHGL
MQASVQFRPQNRDLGMVMRQVDEDLAIFLGMKNAEKEKNEHSVIRKSNEFDESKGVEPKSDSLLILNASQEEIFPISADDNLLDLEIERSDYNWLVTQQDSSLIPSVEVDVQDSAASQTKISYGEAISVKSQASSILNFFERWCNILENTCEESASLRDSPLHQDSSTSTDSSAMAIKRPLSSENRKPTPRAATPTARSTMPSKSKPSRASTPTSRSTLPSSKPTAAQSRSSSRSSTPSRPSIPIVSKSAPTRSATPTHRPAAPSTTSDRSSSGRKMGPAILKTSVPFRGTSPTVKSRPSKPSDTLSLSHDATQNPKVSIPKRPVSASNEKQRQKSCSPAKVRAPISGGNKMGSKMLSRSRGYSNEGDEVNPVLMGTKMVDRVVNMRKLAPPRQDEYVSQDNTRKSSGQENSGFGRSLSKKSLDMAIRHMVCIFYSSLLCNIYCWLIATEK